MPASGLARMEQAAMRETPRPRPLYLDGESSPVFGFLHDVGGDARRDVAVLICPPFGWDDVCSYRSRREWAIHLALGGYATLRFDLPGSGDSAGSPHEPARLQAWVDAAASAAGWLRSQTGARRIAAIGIGLGGLVADVALSQGAQIDDLVLWATPARGRTYLRELRAFASLEDEGLSPTRARRGSLRLAERAPDSFAGQLEAGGFVMSVETVQALEALDLTELSIPNPAGRHVLMLKRDGLPVDASLQGQLDATGVAVSVAKVQGYGSMMARPQDAVSPTHAFAEVDRWLGELSRPTVDAGSYDRHATATAIALPAGELAGVELELDGTAIRETPFFAGTPSEELFGIVAEPVGARAADVCVVLFNAGAMHHIGPNRMWVEMARRWAARGVPVARVDLAALGDSEGDPLPSGDVAALYTRETSDQVRVTLDALEARGVARRFVLGGLCSGAYWSFHGALQDERVVSTLLLNPRAFFWDPNLERMRELRSGLRSGTLWRRAAHGEASFARIRKLLQWSPSAPLMLARRAVSRRRARRLGGDELDRAFDSLRDSGKTLMVAFSGKEPLYEELAREGRLKRLERWPNLTLELLPGSHHTLRQVDVQQATHQVLDEAMTRELARLELEPGESLTAERTHTALRPASRETP
jgi:pimeloyl-ACP methyl ester carboxylesterase